MQCGAAETIGQHPAQHRAVIHVEPFGGGDEGAEVAGAGELTGFQKKMHVQACKPACGEAE